MLDLTPALVLSMWAGGIALFSAPVALWRIVGPGYLWLTGGTVAALALGAALTGDGPWAWIGFGASVAAIAVARRPEAAAALFVAAAVGLLLAAGGNSPLTAAITGLVFTGGVTSEMILGHWYLVAPRMPRWALLRLAAYGGVGLTADVIYVIARGGLGWSPEDAILGWAFLVLSATTALLMVGVWFALQERGYTGVMAATGLSYLAVLTAFGVAVLGRQLLLPVIGT